MEDSSQVSKASQFREHLRLGLLHRARWLYQSKRVGLLGPRAYLDADVHLLRFASNIFIEADVAIKRGAHICSCNEAATVRIGARTTVGYHTFIFASEQIAIGADCLIAPFVYIVDSDHGSARAKPINQQINLTAPISIGRDVWIGVGARILKGVSIGDGAIVAAGAVVKDSVRPFTVVGGVPARVIGERQ